MSQVSRAWQSLTLDGQLWGSLVAFPSFSPALLGRISSIAGPFVRALRLEGMTTVKPDTLLTILSNISTVQTLRPPAQYGAREELVTNLTDINFQGCSSISTRSLHKLLASSPSLERLCLRGLNAVTNSTCGIIGDANTKLISLDLGRCANMDAHGIMSICTAYGRTAFYARGRQPSALKELRMSGLKRVFPAMLSAIATTFPVLEVLDLSYAKSLTDGCIERLTEWHPDYDDDPFRDKVPLTWREMGFQPGDRTIYFKRATSLRHVNLSYCIALTDHACSHLAHAVPLLELLELAGIGPGIEDNGIVRLIQTTPLIRKIDLEDASALTDEFHTTLTPIPPAPESPRRGLVRKRTNRPKQPGESLEQLSISYAQLFTSEALGALIRACPKLVHIDADNTRITDSVVAEFVTLSRQRQARGARIVAVDCRNVGRAAGEELRGVTRPRSGLRSWEAARFGLAYVDARDEGTDGREYIRGGPPQDECDERRVTMQTYWSWQAVDLARMARERRKRILASRRTTEGGASGGRGGSRWITPWSPSSRRTSGHNTPGIGEGLEDPDRGCIIM